MFSHEMKPGDRYAPLAFAVSPEMNEQFLYALRSYHRRYLEGASGKPALVHPVILLHYTPRTRSPSYRLAPGMGSVFARDDTKFLRPAYVGETLTVTWVIDDVYERKGRTTQDYSAEIRNGSDEIVLQRKISSVFMVGGGAS